MPLIYTEAGDGLRRHHALAARRKDRHLSAVARSTTRQAAAVRLDTAPSSRSCRISQCNGASRRWYPVPLGRPRRFFREDSFRQGR